MRKSQFTVKLRKIQGKNNEMAENSSKISRDLDADEEHTHDISKNNGGDTSRSIRDLNGSSAVSIECEIKEYDTNAT